MAIKWRKDSVKAMQEEREAAAKAEAMNAQARGGGHGLLCHRNGDPGHPSPPDAGFVPGVGGSAGRR